LPNASGPATAVTNMRQSTATAAVMPSAIATPLCVVIEATIIPAIARAQTTSTMRRIHRGFINRGNVPPVAIVARPTPGRVARRSCPTILPRAAFPTCPTRTAIRSSGTRRSASSCPRVRSRRRHREPRRRRARRRPPHRARHHRPPPPAVIRDGSTSARRSHHRAPRRHRRLVRPPRRRSRPHRRVPPPPVQRLPRRPRHCRGRDRGARDGDPSSGVRSCVGSCSSPVCCRSS